MEKTLFVWIIDATRDPRWWDRLAFTMDSLVRCLPPGEDFTFRVLDCGTDTGPSASREWIVRTFGPAVIEKPYPAHLEWAVKTYRDFGMTEFCPAIFLRLAMAVMPHNGFTTVVSVDIDAEWKGGVSALLAAVRATGNPIAMVRDPYWRTWGDRVPFGKMPPREMIADATGRPFPADDQPYFGAGLVCYRPNLLTIDLWKVMDRLLILGSKTVPFGWPEQDVLNLATPAITPLDPRFDVFGCEAEERRRDAYLIQYAGKEKPILDAKVAAFINAIKG